ncbi:MAG: hypothetical protein GEU28_00690 [Dehalococcoidia bacterium]|nr:hypothetical protein [Dehalococcoidia bacterium]
MTRTGLVLAGVVAWLAVAGAAIALQEWDQFWGFFVLLVLVVAAWAIGEWVTEKVLLAEEDR